MKKRLFIYTTLLIFVALLCFLAASVYISYDNNLQIAKNAVMQTTRIYASMYDESTDLDLFVKASEETRISIIRADGTILADNHPFDVDTTANRLDRPEIIAASRNAPEVNIRYSESLGMDLIYYAVKVGTAEEHVFVRAAIPVRNIEEYFFQTLPLLIFIMFIVISLCFAFSRRMIDRILAPLESVGLSLRLLASGEYSQSRYLPTEIPEKSYDEVDSIVMKINEVAEILENNIEALESEKAKAGYILNNIGDGIFAVDKDMAVTMINNAALDIFKVTSAIIGKDINYLTYHRTLVTAVRDCVNQKKLSLFELELGGRNYFITVKRLPDTSLSMVLLSDVTDSRNSAKQREEFFTNASHELKTPLTAIKGFNELTNLNNKDEEITRYIDGITRETDRMLLLIRDMLKLSELENNVDLTSEPVPLLRVVEETQSSLSLLISEKAISFSVSGEGEVSAVPEHIYELIKNLVENAIRYTEQGGTVTVAISKTGLMTRLVVTDNGIGIPLIEQTRIFERFYRVEKSRTAKNSGGTGLGLSIVKHICARYGFELTLNSKLGIGTEVTVGFPSNT
ncbi:MAG: hypothetical protein LBC96_09520 [Lachnospiraceae bacterium]|jgi:two-component system phosphate regulon sensor histidine kinase PhoR|nr:hypothetical protein [Lachnospiraceae bacterium]